MGSFVIASLFGGGVLRGSACWKAWEMENVTMRIRVIMMDAMRELRADIGMLQSGEDHGGWSIIGDVVIVIQGDY